MVREGMAEMLSTVDDMAVVGQAANGVEAVSLAREKRSDVVILDVEMPVMGAHGALRRMLDLSPAPKVIIVTVFADQRLIRDLLRLGASAYLVKNASMQELIATVRSVARGEGEESVIVSAPRSSFEQTGQSAGGTEGALTSREMEILLAVARGMGNKQAGQKLHISETTIKRHLSSVYAKLDVGTRNEAVRRAMSEGWISAWDISKDD